MLYRGAAPALPDILVNHDVWADVSVKAELHSADVDNLPADVARLPVEWRRYAVFEDVRELGNFGHDLTENLLQFFFRCCVYLNQCEGTAASSAAEWFLYPLSQRTWYTPTTTWREIAPYIAELLPCFAPGPVLHFEHPSLHGQVVVFEKALLGLGKVYRRVREGNWTDYGKAQFEAPPKTAVESFRKRAFQCLKLPQPSQQGEQLKVVFIQRADNARGRHFLHLADTVARTQQLFPGAYVRVIRPHELTVADQALPISQADILILAHGAAQSNVIWTKPGAVIIEYVRPGLDIPFGGHGFLQQILQDLNLPVTMLGVSGKDLMTAEWNKAMLLPEKEAYGNMTSEQKLAFYEVRSLEGTPLQKLPSHWGIDFALEWDVLEPALQWAKSLYDQSYVPTKFDFHSLDAPAVQSL